MKQKLTHTRNSLPEKTRIEITALLQERLADSIDLMMQAKQAHWNVKGPNFIALHELFDKVFIDVGGYVDVIAERIVQLGGIAQGTIRAAAKKSSLPEYPLQISSGKKTCGRTGPRDRFLRRTDAQGHRDRNAAQRRGYRRHFHRSLTRRRHEPLVRRGS